MSPAWVERADQLLKVYVDERGRVDYEALARDTSVEDVLAEIGAQDPRGFPDEAHALAFYLNAYNLAALGIALRMARRDERLLRTGLRGLWSRARFFLLERVRVARRSRSLFGLEFLTIHRRFRDPRIHFALVCATASCPPLRHGAFTADAIEEDLETAARFFMRPGIGYRLDRDADIVEFNRIFKWYRRDFRAVGGPLGALGRWGDPDDAAFVRSRNVRVRFAPYDWSLNRSRT